jgi:PIN domain nuclease of toxin-antitoxin system
MVLIELQFLYEIGRTSLSAKDIQRKLESELGVRVCDLDFAAIANAAVDEQWTRDPFDRIIVSHARANGLAYLVTSDELIRKNYPRAIWD